MTWRCTFITVLLTGLAWPAYAVDRPTTEIPRESCVTASCHVGVKDHAVLHGPVNVNACEACHTLEDAATHKFKLTRNEKELCTFCHQMPLEGAKLVHKPLTTGECLPCHNPHGGFDRASLRGKSLKDACNQCHEPVATPNHRAVHGPVAAGACTVCHQPHTGERKNLLVAEGNALCLLCHTQMQDAMAKAKFKHEAVEQDCMSCHDPHASDYPMMVKQAPVELCTKCHEPVKQAALAATHKHKVVTEGDACLYCHTAHGSDLKHLMKSQPIKVCMQCHEKPLLDDAGKTLVAGVGEVLDPRLIKHGPINDGSCGGCHNVHGSNVTALLAKEYPAQFYAPFDVDNYAICFTCHDQQLVELPKTDKLTNFRNGEVNMHYLHVNKQKGRTCRACHATHVSGNKVHIRESVPFGQWELPINYQPTATGGTCTPGCHQQLGYNRDQPAAPAAGEVKPAAEAAAPAAPVAPTAPARAPVQETQP